MHLTHTLKRTPVPILLAKVLRLQLSGTARNLIQSFGRQGPQPLTLEELHIPDSELTRAATALVTQIEPVMLLNHSIRTFFFGAAIGRHLRMHIDTELLYLGAVLHDIGLVTPYDLDGSFEVNGARGAHNFLREHGVNAERADLVHEAIALHSSIGAVDTHCPEIALVRYGAGMDVAGLRYRDVASETRKAIIAKYPRHDFKRKFSRLLEEQAHRKPDCHIAGHLAVGFARHIHAAPFSE